LYLAGQNGNYEVVQEFLKHGANVNTANEDVVTSLYRDRERGHVEVF